MEMEKALAEELKAGLEKLQGQAGSSGLRSGNLCFVARTKAGRRTLDTDLLMLNGVTRDQIDDSYKRGKPYVERTFRRLGKEVTGKIGRL
jgi:hypothetical protein